MAEIIAEIAKETVVGIIGLGLMGGSFGMALRAAGGYKVLGWDSGAGIGPAAVKAGASDLAPETMEGLAAESDVVIVATPSSIVSDVALSAAAFMREGSILTDMGSVKTPIVDSMKGRVPRSVYFVGGHPMAGSEKSGLEAASASLYKGAVWVLTPAPDTPSPVLEKLGAIVRSVGAEPLIAGPEEHDRAVAASSHLPYIAAVATALVAAGNASGLPLVTSLLAGGFRDITRVARADPGIAMDYCFLNRDLVLSRIDDLRRQLGELRDSLARNDMDGLVSRANSAREYLLRSDRSRSNPNG